MGGKLCVYRYLPVLQKRTSLLHNRDNYSIRLLLISACSLGLTQLIEGKDMAIAGSIFSEEGLRFEEIVSQYEAEVFRLGLVLTNNLPDAESVLCDVFCAAYDELPDGVCVRTWLYEKTLEIWFSRQHEAPKLEIEEEEEYGSAEASEEFSRKLEKAIGDLPYDHKVIFVLHDVDGFTKAEISALLLETETDIATKLRGARLMVCRAMQRKVQEKKVEIDFIAARI